MQPVSPPKATSNELPLSVIFRRRPFGTMIADEQMRFKAENTQGIFSCPVIMQAFASLTRRSNVVRNGAATCAAEFSATTGARVPSKSKANMVSGAR